MMLEDAGFERNEKSTGRNESVQRKEKAVEQMFDREVPLTGTSRSMLHEWLDGEVDIMRASESEGASKVELWTRINAESEMLRRRVTPIHVQQRIMSSLPAQPGTASSWWKQQVTMSPVSAIAIAAALLAVGALFITMIS